MRIRFISALFALALSGFGIASCTQDFGQFEPKPGATPECAAGEKSCNGACVAIDDPLFGCGSGCTPCALENANAACSAGNCDIGSCISGFADCDGNKGTGCEVDTGNDATNCGACDTQCSAPNAMAACQNGACALGACNAGFENCDNQAGNGCEAILNSDPNNCGTCGNQCNAFQTCSNGTCKNNPCGPGTADCNSDPSDGCEIPIDTTANCGFCNNACNLANANEACVMGMCSIESCVMGFADCDMNDGNGCEVAVDTVNNCGTCGNVCPSGPNSTATCTNAMCGINCAMGFADCNNNPADGCEVDLQTSTGNCGSCGYACSNTNATTTACVAGQCAPTCVANFGDCVKPVAPMPDNGCETIIVDDVFNCGACGRTCSATNTGSRECTGSVCTSTCDLGFANCTQPGAGMNDNGCELNSQTNGMNCGGCGNDCVGALSCGAGPLMQKQCGCTTNPTCGMNGMCSMGTCSCNGTTCAMGENCNAGACTCNGGASCGAGMLCCQMPAACVDPYSDPDNCGACGRACPNGFICTGMAPMAPQCRCNEDADCNGGMTGMCMGNGQCSCGGVTCAIGERCLSNGTCG